MINVGRQLKAGFRSVMQEQGQDVVIISHWNTPFQVIIRVKGVKSNKEGRPDYSVFQFTEAYSIENGSIIYVPKNDTYWRVLETEDRILGNVYVLFEAKTNKTWLQLDEKEFDELILGAKGPDGHTFDNKPLAPPPISKPATPPSSEPPKEPVSISPQIAYTPPPTPPLPGLNKGPSPAKSIPSNQSDSSDKPVNADRLEPEPKSSNPPTKIEEIESRKAQAPSTSENHAEDQSNSDFIAEADGAEEIEVTPKSEIQKETRFVRESSPKLPFRKRSDQLYVTRQINSLMHSIPKADLEERMKSEAISALKAIEDLLVEEVTEKERNAANKRLGVIISALDQDLEFAVNVAAYLPPIYTYFGLEID
jgi:hypothetical protein